MKKVEKLVSLKLEPVSIEVHGDTAAIHYITYETVAFTAEGFLVTAGSVMGIDMTQGQVPANSLIQ